MTRRLPLLLAASLVAVLSACGVSDGGSDAGTTTTKAEATTTAPDSKSTTTEPDDTTSTEVEQPTDGDTFRSEDGQFVMDIGADWEPSASQSTGGVELWYLGGSSGSFGANVNVLSQKTPGMDMQEYLDKSLPGIDNLLDDGEVIDNRVIEGTEGQELGILEYAGTLQGQDLHFLAVATPVEDGVALATFTATDDQFDDLRDSVEPYLRTLRAA